MRRSLVETLDFKKVNTPAISSGVLTLDLSTGRFFNVSLNANVTTLTITNVPSGVMTSFEVVFKQDSTGSRTISWPSNFYFENGLPLVLGTLPNDVALLRFATFDSGSTWVCTFNVPSVIFSPYSLKYIYPTNVHYWFDFTNKDYLYQDTACTNPVTATGQSIAAIKDRLSSGMILTQATSSKRPIYRESSGIGYAEFSTSAQSSLLTTSTPLAFSIQDYSVAVGSRFDYSGSGADDIYGLWTMMGSGPKSNCEPFGYITNLRKNFGTYNHGGSGSISPATTTNSQDNKKTSAFYRRTGSLLRFKVKSEDGETATSNTSQSWTSVSSSTFGIGYYDPTFTSAYSLNGRIYSIVGSNLPYSDEVQDKVIEFIKNRSGF